MTSILEEIETMARRVDTTLAVDRHRLRHQIRCLREAARKPGSHPRLAERAARIARRINESAEVRDRRLFHALSLQFDPQLPITALKDRLIETIGHHQVIIVAGETGSGKSTQLPKLCLAAGRGIDGRIGVTQPRRIAAMTVARRIAQELGEELGQTVGYQIRFQDTTAPHTRVKLMTDGILLAEIHQDPYLNQYDTLIIDEAHERSLNIDFILGFLKKLLRRRPELKLIITSATLDTEKFAAAFDGAPVIQVSGRLYDVETFYLDPAAETEAEGGYVEQAVQVVDDLQRQRTTGDILIFMPTEQDIRGTCDLLAGRRNPGWHVIALFARLSSGEQQKVFQPTPGRKIVVATNVAETSITIPGIRYVIDTGLARISQYTPRSRTTTLPVTAVSQSSADQRKGRCGRVANGVCFRLYSAESYDQRPRFTTPEIVRCNLASAILKMIALNLGDVQDFPFIDPPQPRSIQDGYQMLLELDAIQPKDGPTSGGGKYVLTSKGRLMARLPLDPRLACILLAAQQRGCLDEAAVITAALSIQDPRERPLEKQGEADRIHAAFGHPLSDFIPYLNIWRGYQQVISGRAGWNRVRQYCRQHFLSFRRMREWQDIYHQILQVLSDHQIKSVSTTPITPNSADIHEPWYAALHQSILSGFLSNMAIKKERQFFQAAHNRQAMIFPGSGLFKNPGLWIVAAEMVATSRLFARCAAVIDPSWAVEIAPHQCRYTYLEPHWERRRGQVVATEQVSLYGLILLRRPRPFGPVDPPEATRIFIRQALIQGDVRQPMAFMVHNRQLIDEAQDLENRLRRRDLLVDEMHLEEFYFQRLHPVYDWRMLKQRLDKEGGDGFLRLTRAEVLNYQPDDLEVAAYPDAIPAGPVDLACDYRFDPGQEQDGVTVQVAERDTAHITAEAFQWLVPGLLREKITALVKALPKEYRRRLLPINTTVDTIVREMPVERRTGLHQALSRFVYRRFGLQVPAAVWNENQLADHLRIRIAVVDAQGRVIRAGRDTQVLQHVNRTPAAPDDDLQKALQKWERRDVRSWDFGDLPESMTLSGIQGRHWMVCPGLEERDDLVWLTARTDPAVMHRIHPQGVKALLRRHFAADLKFLKKNLQLSAAFEPHCRYFGGRPEVEASLLAKVLDDLLARNVRTAAEFEALRQSLERQDLPACGRTTRQCLMDVLAVYWTTRQQLFELEKTHARNAGAQELLSQLRDMLTALVPKNFILLYDDARLVHLLRYIKALGVRAQRGVLDLEKDHAKACQYEPFARRLAQLAQELSAEGGPEKRQAVEAFYWMVEEFKISLFAQEIGTDQPISAKRLKSRLDLIERLG